MVSDRSVVTETLLRLLDGSKWATARRDCGKPARIALPDEPAERAALVEQHIHGETAELTFYRLDDHGEESVWTERVSAVQLIPYTPRADGRVQALIADQDGTDHSEKGLADPSAAARYLASAADCYGSLDGALVASSRRGVGRHFWLTPPSPFSLIDATLALARLISRAFALAREDVADGAAHPFRTITGGVAEPGQAGAFETRPYSTEAPPFGWATLLPASGAAAQVGGGLIVDAFNDEPTDLEQIPICDPAGWAELVASGHARQPKPKVEQPTKSSFTGDDTVQKARRYVAKMPPAIAFQGGHNATFRVACVLVGLLKLPEAAALECLREFNARCDPPWSEKELAHKLRDAIRETRGAA